MSIHFVPLSQGDEEQSSGGGMFLRSPLIRSPLIRSPLIRSPLIRSSLIRLPLFYYIPPPLRLTQRRNRDCDPQRVQNDI